MPETLNVHFLPSLADPHELAGHTTVVIDVLRATTTIAAALAAGAQELIPCLEVEEARQLARQHSGALLAGERGGQPIGGFDLGNSPAEYTAERVAGRTIVFTTTNGTRALTQCIGSGRVLFGALVNMTALCRVVQHDARVDLICAGTNGEISRDDVLTAGAIVDWLQAGGNSQRNDQAQISGALWREATRRARDRDALAEALRDTAGGRALHRIGGECDIQWAAEFDRLSLVPELDRANWRIRAVSA
jgi:2-phosphosulfolactate phosphatase